MSLLVLGIVGYAQNPVQQGLMEKGKCLIEALTKKEILVDSLTSELIIHLSSDSTSLYLTYPEFQLIPLDSVGDFKLHVNRLFLRETNANKNLFRFEYHKFSIAYQGQIRITYSGTACKATVTTIFRSIE